MSVLRLRHLVGGFGLQCLAWHAAAQPLPELHMHVFEQAPAAPSSAPPVDPAPSSENRRFQMLVFQTSAAPKQTGRAAAPVLERYPRRAPRRKAANDFTVLIATDIGYQQERLSWAVASPLGGDPLTEVKWDGIDMVRLKGRFDMASPRGVVLRTEAGYAWALNGNGEQISSGLPAASGAADDSHAWHASAGLGYRLRFGDPSRLGASVTPLAGYAFHGQHFTLQGVEENSYDTEWDGPWAGLDASLNWLEDHELFASAQYHWASYRGTGHWGQVAEARHPDSFEHRADATGMVGSVGYRYRSPRAWGLSLSMDYQEWQADSGEESFYLASGDVIHSKLSDILLDALAINLGIDWRF